MLRRYKLNRRTSNRKFRRGQRTQGMNTRPRPMRGSTRL